MKVADDGWTFYFCTKVCSLLLYVAFFNFVAEHVSQLLGLFIQGSPP